jgi:hypothetical protein
MHFVRVGTLLPDAAFRTTLTRRIGIVLGEREGSGIPVYLEPLHKGDVFEEKTLAPEIIVAVDDVATASTSASTTLQLTQAA